MTVLAFKPNFKEPILNGTKIHTIREGNRWCQGKQIHMATGVRTKNYNQFNKGRPELTTCKSTQRINIWWDMQFNALQKDESNIIVFVDGRNLDKKEILKLAINDGFNSVADFAAWFKAGLTNGQIVHWTDLKY